MTRVPSDTLLIFFLIALLNGTFNGFIHDNKILGSIAGALSFILSIGIYTYCIGG